MRRRTTTRQIDSAITNNLLSIEKVEIYYKTSKETEAMDSGTFKDNLDFLSESGVFSGFVDWHYGMSPSEKGEYIIESGAKNPYSENIVTVYLRVGEDVIGEEIERNLLFEDD